MKQPLILLSLVTIISGCSTIGSHDRAFFSTQRAPTNPLIELSQDSVDEVEQAFNRKIARYLSTQVQLPEQNRIAIVKLESSAGQAATPLELNEQTYRALIQPLQQSPRVYDVAFLPSMLRPRSNSLTELRQAAALFRADLLLTYQSDCTSFTQHKVFAANQLRAYCDVEALLIDVRSGIITKTVVSRQDWTSAENDADISFGETIAKAQLTAINLGFKAVSSEIVSYLQQPVIR